MRSTYRYIEDETVVLDGDDLTNAVLRRCNLVYNGGPLKLEGALFFECAMKWEDGAAPLLSLNTAIFRSLYAAGYRHLTISADGEYQAT